MGADWLGELKLNILKKEKILPQGIIVQRVEVHFPIFSFPFFWRILFIDFHSAIRYGKQANQSKPWNTKLLLLFQQF